MSDPRRTAAELADWLEQFVGDVYIADSIGAEGVGGSLEIVETLRQSATQGAEIARLRGLVALVREWQDARKPTTLAAPGEFIAETFQAAVRRMSAADEALAGYDLNGPAGGALVGQTAPTESTGPYLCACTCGCGDRTIRPGRCMVCRVRESCLKNEWTCEACAAGYRLAADGMHYDHDDSTWGVCRKVVASFRREEP